MRVWIRITSLLLVLPAIACDSGGSPALSVEAPGGPTSAASTPPSSSGADVSSPPSPREQPADLPRVDLAGVHHPLPLGTPGTPRLYARHMRAWIRAEPARKAQRLGYLRAGASAPIRGEPVGRDGCSGGWYPIVPEGFVCLGRRTTLDPSDPVVRATEEHPPEFGRKLPYIYGTVRRPGPVYQRLPQSAELERAESDFAERYPEWLDAPGEVGAGYAQEVWVGGDASALVDPRRAWETKQSDALPAPLANGHVLPNVTGAVRRADAVVGGRMRPRVGYSLFSTFLHQGRRYGLSTELELVPTDRLRPIRGSAYHGFGIGGEQGVEFPFAIVRRRGAKTWIYQSSSGRLVDAGMAPYFTALPLSGKQRFFHQRLHYETKDGKWISDQDASRLDPARRMPKWGKNGERWIDVNLTKQTALLYEGERPVYATLISSGEAGLEDPQHTTATKRGIFRIHTKHITATMSSDELGEEFELRDVPYVQYFDRQGYALHGAYWHDRFGIPKSHGCINLTPEDARRIFWWTSPAVPPGWHGALLPLKGTVMFIHP